MHTHHPPSTPTRADSETISISIGLGGETRAASSIVLPRGHDLVKHLELLLPQIAQAAATAQHQHQSPPSATAPQHHSSFAPPSRYDAAPHSHMMHQRHHPYMSAGTSHRYAMPPSPYQSDSSHDSATQSHGVYGHAATQHAGVRRRRGPAGQSAGKKCQFPECEKISVSRGLCRGHGGGRRCQFAGCSKGAQSRSDFCWAHGGGQRCEVKNCMRSRKSKRFCVAHLSWESVAPGESALLDSASPSYRAYEQPIMPKPPAPFPAPSAPLVHFPSLASSAAAKLPSLQQALQKNQSQPQCVSAATGRPTFVHQHLHTAVLNSASG